MTDLISPDQISQIRQAFTDLSDTFAFPIVIKRTNYVSGAFASSASTSTDIEVNAIRDYGSAGNNDQSRNAFGPRRAHEYDLYVGWLYAEEAGLVDGSNKVLLDHNDLVEMEGEIYEIQSFAGIADMTKKPSFLQLRVKRRFANPVGAATP